MQRNNRGGFTLLEMLVSIILMTLLLAVALVSYRYLLLHFKRTQHLFPEKTVRFQQLRTAIQSMRHYVVYPEQVRPEERVAGHDFFEADAAGLRFVTEHPVIGDTLSLAAFKCTGSTLDYYEQALYEGGMDYRQPKMPQSVLPLVIFKDVSKCAFSYLPETGVPREVWLDITLDRQPYRFVFRVQSDFDYARNLTDVYNDEL